MTHVVVGIYLFNLFIHSHPSSYTHINSHQHHKMPLHNNTNLTPHESRVIGALLGVHAGDSLGATVEFSSHDQIARKFPNGLRKIIGGGPFSWSAGHATDDTDMTRGILLAYRDYKPGNDIGRLAGNYFLKWFNGDWPDRRMGSEPVDIGGATREGLWKYSESRDPELAGAGHGSAGNGSLMRCIPTGLFQTDADKLVAESQRISQITHNDKRCTVACAAYNMIVSGLIKGLSPTEAITSGILVAKAIEGVGEVSKAIEVGKTLNIEEMAQKGPSPQLQWRCTGYVLESLSLAIAAILDERSFEDVLVDVVRIGGDTDTNGAIAGGLLGARDGVDAIPENWREKLQFGKEFWTVALELLRN